MKIIVNKRILSAVLYGLICLLAFGAGRFVKEISKSKTIEIFTAGAKLGYLTAIKDLQAVERYSTTADYLSDDKDVYYNASRYLYTNYEEGGFNGKQLEQDIKEVRSQIERSFK